MGSENTRKKGRILQFLLLSLALVFLFRIPSSAAVTETVKAVYTGNSYSVSGYASAKSSKPARAAVSTLSSGKIKITGKKAGRATITYYNKKGKAVAKDRVIVLDYSSIKYDTAKLNLQIGSSKKVKATIPSSCTVKYTSSDSEIAKVSSTGKITAVKKGSATISAKIYYKGTKIKTMKKSVHVTSSAPGKSTTTVLGNTQTKKVTSRYIRYYDSKGNLVRTIDKKKKMVALTYDDGPAAGTTTILNTLKKYNSAATFFVVGERVSSYSSTVKKAFKQGCEIGNHTWGHETLTSLSSASIQSTLKRTNTAVKNITGVDPVVMRPPGGSYNSTVRSVTGSMGMPIIYWSIDTRDWETKNATTTYNSVINNVKDGDIVLMHDLWPSTATASKNIIPKLIEKGYQLVTVSELGEARGTLKAGSVYTRIKK